MSSFFGAWICGNRRRSAAMMSRGLVDRERRLRDVREPASRRAARAPRPRPTSARARSRRAPRPSSRRPPRARRARSGRSCSRRRRSAGPATCTFVTSGQVASITLCPSARRVRVHRRRDAVRREDDGRALRHVGLARRRRSRRAARGRARRGCCGRSACGRRPARRRARAPARPSRRRARHPRSTRAARRAGPARPCRRVSGALRPPVFDASARGLREHDPTSATTAPPASWAATRSPRARPRRRSTRRTPRPSRRSTTRRRREVVEGAPGESTNGRIVPSTIIQARGPTGAADDSARPGARRCAKLLEREVTTGCTTAHEDAGERRARDARQRERVAAAGRVLADEEVGRERAGGEQSGGDADVSSARPPTPPRRARARRGERECRPYAAADVLVPHHARPERDENGRGELEQEADPDRQALDRDEVEPRDEGEADDPVEDEQPDLVPADPESPGSRERDERPRDRGMPRSRAAP